MPLATIHNAHSLMQTSLSLIKQLLLTVHPIFGLSTLVLFLTSGAQLWTNILAFTTKWVKNWLALNLMRLQQLRLTLWSLKPNLSLALTLPMKLLSQEMTAQTTRLLTGTRLLLLPLTHLELLANTPTIPLSASLRTLLTTSLFISLKTSLLHQFAVHKTSLIFPTLVETQAKPSLQLTRGTLHQRPSNTASKH